MRNLTTIFCFLFISFSAIAQQDAHYTQFMYNKLLLNPAFSGARQVNSISALYRTQWIGFDGHPQSYLLSYDGIVAKEALGYGIVLHSQTDGIINQKIANISLSYNILHVTDETTLRIGLSGALRQYTFDLQNPNIYIKDRLDPSLQQSDAKLVNANVGAGIYFDNKEYYIGVSIPNLMKNPVFVNANTAASNISGVETPHIYVMAGGFFKLFNNDDLHLKPSLMFKQADDSPYSLDLNVSVAFQKTFTAGVSYRTGGKYKGDPLSGSDSFDLLAFLQANSQLGVGVAYDFTLSQLAQYSQGSIEAVLRYDFVPSGLSSQKKVMHNPRYFF